MKKVEFYSNSNEETKEIAINLAKTFKGGEVILASGPMGSGKTAFCQGIGKGLGITKTINSPTFNLMKVYSSKSFTLYHIDCYRLENADEKQKDLGLDEIIGDKNTICYIEWPNFGDKTILNYHPIIRLTIDYIDEKNRKLVIEDERQ